MLIGIVLWAITFFINKSQNPPAGQIRDPEHLSG